MSDALTGGEALAKIGMQVAAANRIQHFWAGVKQRKRDRRAKAELKVEDVEGPFE